MLNSISLHLSTLSIRDFILSRFKNGYIFVSYLSTYLTCIAFQLVLLELVKSLFQKRLFPRWYIIREPLILIFPRKKLQFRLQIELNPYLVELKLHCILALRLRWTYKERRAATKVQGKEN